MHITNCLMFELYQVNGQSLNQCFINEDVSQKSHNIKIAQSKLWLDSQRQNMSPFIYKSANNALSIRASSKKTTLLDECPRLLVNRYSCTLDYTCTQRYKHIIFNLPRWLVIKHARFKQFLHKKIAWHPYFTCFNEIRAAKSDLKP